MDALSHSESNARYAALTDKPRPLELWTAEQLGVHPAIPGTDDLGAMADFTLPTYIKRRHDRVLRKRLRSIAAGNGTALIVIRGESCTGKTRTAFEGIRACLEGWQLVFPKTADSLLAVLAARALTPRTVLWLNEAQNYLTGSSGEAAAAALRTQLEEPGPVLIIATLWPKYYDDLTQTPEYGHDQHTHSRSLLGPVMPLCVPDSFDDESLRALRTCAYTDHSLAHAEQTSPDARITQTLAAGPELVDYYEHVIDACTRALIVAASDAIRLGVSSPLRGSLLRDAALDYLTPIQRARATPDWYEKSIKQACRMIKGVTAALLPTPNPTGFGALPDHYNIADYLHQHLVARRQLTCPPASWWDAILQNNSNPDDLVTLANSASRRGRIRYQALFAERAADFGNFNALAPVAHIKDVAGDFSYADNLVERVAAARVPHVLRMAAEYRFSIGNWSVAEKLLRPFAAINDAWSLRRLAKILDIQGDSSMARRYAELATEAGDPDAQWDLAMSRIWSDGEGAIDVEILLQQAHAAGCRVAMDLLQAFQRRSESAERKEQRLREGAARGDTEREEELWRHLRQQGKSDAAKVVLQNAVDCNHIWALLKLSEMRQEDGDTPGELEILRRAFGVDPACAVRRLCEILISMGKLREAEELMFGKRTPGFQKLHTEIFLEAWEERGEGERAEKATLGEASSASHWGISKLLEIRERRSDTDGAERLVRLASAKQINLLSELVKIRVAGGRLADAETLLPRAFETRDVYALNALAVGRSEAGDQRGAEELLHHAMDFGDEVAARDLGVACAQRADWQGAIRFYRRALDGGYSSVLWNLAGIVEKVEGYSSAEQMRRFGIEPGGQPSPPWPGDD
ncbi:tetratricopeptide repeat protein [Streptomyces silvisoli]|uniref:Sel1 repeat family protein n=1 Tax=Streptomyces silvisoli TaxID=3034235 RepID=A0ABT5ZEW7_9ACTN|nr:hypothetical protein [Streptomyces silvisoli]MDF3288367.1 hypothetical protein [Streptomyces silvisoli]